MKNRYITYFLVMFTFLLISSCQPHDPFCYQHTHGALVRINVDWSEFKEDKPDGMTLHFLPSNKNNKPKLHTTHTITHASVDLMPEQYTILVHNQSASEFGSVTFQDMGCDTTACVLPKRSPSTWYKPVDNEILVSNPEWLAFDREEALVTEDMMTGGTIYEERITRSNGDNDTLVATMTPKNVVYTLHVSVKIKGINNFRDARAAFSGLADGYFIGLEEYSDEKVTHMMETWSVKNKTTDEDGVQIGTIYGNITCFGLPKFHTRDAAENILRLSILLVDNKTLVNRMFKVGSRIYQKDTNGSSLHLYLDLELSEKLPDVTPVPDTDGKSGFDADVNEWGDEENQNVGL